MTGPHSDVESASARPISVAELLARNGTIGAPAVTRRRRRRRGDSDAVTVAELTGEIPIIRDDDHDEAGPDANGAVEVAEPDVEPRTERGGREQDVTPEAADVSVTADEQGRPKTAYWAEPEPRWPKSPPQPQPASGPERSSYPRPPRRGEAGEAAGRSGQSSGAEDMSPDPVDDYADVDVMDSEVHDAEPGTGDSPYVGSYLSGLDSELLDDEELDEEVVDGEELFAEPLPDGVGSDRVGERRGVHSLRGSVEAFWRGTVVVSQSVLAVAFGAGLFVAFDQLWRWNSIVALVLSVLVILGLVVGVRVVRKTEDITSTLIAVAVGALITLGPLALSMQSG